MSPICIVFVVVVCREFEGLAVRVPPSITHLRCHPSMGCGFVSISTSPMHETGLIMIPFYSRH